jgi:hypothetical protein
MSITRIREIMGVLNRELPRKAQFTTGYVERYKQATHNTINVCFGENLQPIFSSVNNRFWPKGEVFSIANSGRLTTE